MISWRDTTAAHVQDDLDNLLTAGLQAAQHLLAKNGEFFPFGITVSTDAQISMSGADPGLGEHPESLAVLELLYESAVSKRDTYRAVGFVADVRANGGDAIRVDAEHRDGGPAITALLPYARKGLRKKTLTYSEMTAQPGERRVWPEQ